MCVLLRSYKKEETNVIAVVCVNFNYFTRYLNETSEICVCMSIWRGVILVYLISVRNEIGSGEGHN